MRVGALSPPPLVAATALAVREADVRLRPGLPCNSRGTLSVYLRRATGLEGRSGAGISTGAHAPRVSLSICGQQQSSGAPLGKSDGRTPEWNQRFEFRGRRQDFMLHPLQIKLTSGGAAAASFAPRASP